MQPCIALKGLREAAEPNRIRSEKHAVTPRLGGGESHSSADPVMGPTLNLLAGNRYYVGNYTHSFVRNRRPWINHRRPLGRPITF